jgi:benzoylformate decarboxylase
VLTDSYLLQQIASLRPSGGVIVEEAPSSRGPMHDYLPILDPDGFYTCASGGLGHGLPAAVGVALARPDRKVIAVLGDGSSLYSIQGLWSAVQLKLPIAFIIIRNGRYEALHEFGQLFQLDHLPGTELPAIDFCGFAHAQGMAALRVVKAGELDAALRHAFQSSEPVLVEVVTQNADTVNSGEPTCGPKQ